MKIERVRTYQLRTELTPAEAFSFSQARVGIRTAMLVELVADDGRSGWGAWFEEPVVPEDLEGYLQVKQALGMPISGGEAEYARFGFRALVSRRCVDILQPDICGCGGFTEALRIGALANTWGVTIYPHVWGSAVGLHASVQWAASLPPNPFAVVPAELWFELDRTPNPFRERLTTEPLERAGDIIEVPQRPGLGLEVDRSLLERYQVS
jgi:D-galactarolactone cycloisomerase